MSKNVVQTEGPLTTSEPGAYALRAILVKTTSTYVHVQAHAPGYPHALTQSRARMHTDQQVVVIASSRQQWFANAPQYYVIRTSTYPSCLTSAHGRVCVYRHASAALPPGNNAVPLVWEGGWAPVPVWTGAENLSPPGFDPRAVQPVARRCTAFAITLL
jgi:hypothetical protein